MTRSEIELALAELQAATDALSGTTQGTFKQATLNVDAAEQALATRQQAVARLGDLVKNDPEGFTASDLERVQASHSQGKRALEQLIEFRRTGWTTATEFSQSQHILRTFTAFRLSSSREFEG